MARVKLTARKHVCVPPHRNGVPTESHSDGKNIGYFPRTLRTVLLALGYSEPLLFIGVPRLLRGNSYLWRVRVIIYERPTTDHIRRIRHVVEATAPRWTFTGDMRGYTRSFGIAVTWSGGTNGAIAVLVIPRSEKEGTKPPYVCPGCSNHTHGNNW
jgi:hypothetical protein